MKESSPDIRSLLESWSYEEGKTVRRVTTKEGREVIQVRLPLGIEQYEIDGRPDGRRPAERESWYHHYLDQAEQSPWEFRLDEDYFDRLRHECMLYYHRYLLFFQVNEYKLCARDTERNLNVLDFTARYSSPNMCEGLEQYRPYIIRMNHMARALYNIQEDGDVPGALALLREGMDRIEDLPTMEKNVVFQLEKARSRRSLEDLYQQLENHLPKSREQVLQERLDEAIARENFEEAARLRDEIAGPGDE
ncbi:MAG: UvrB/UvrC motif-containing protein [Planctomycetota bacterium]|nr:UvrB/UvrC motif-containing protein [Planctomycetota bacterium]